MLRPMTPDAPKTPPELDAAVDRIFAYGRHKRVLAREEESPRTKPSARAVSVEKWTTTTSGFASLYVMMGGGRAA